jgi:small neutral amino acid transporter SnatA (MarC family)
VRRLVRTEVGLVVVFAASLLVAYIGLAVCVTGKHRVVGGLVLVLAVWSMVAAPVVHDRVHRESGEQSHVVWGRDGRRKPSWWPRRP